MTTSAPTALVLLFDGVEEIEVVTPIDLLRRAGLDVTVASLGAQRRVRGRTDIFLEADTTLASVGGRVFDVVVLPGGPGVKALRAAPAVVALARDQVAAGRLLAAICAAPTVLEDAGVLAGRRYTAHTSVAGELPAMATDQAVVRDGPVITSRGAGTAIPFALAIIEALRGPDAARQVAAAICHPH